MITRSSVGTWYGIGEERERSDMLFPKNRNGDNFILDGVFEKDEKSMTWKTFTGNYSKNSFNLFSRIVDEYPEFKNACFGENETVIDLQDSEISKDFLKPDFLWNNKIIEFNGTYWHRDPRFFEDTIENQNIRKRDNERITVLRKKGYEVKVVWETEYENNPFELLDECVFFLKKM